MDTRRPHLTLMIKPASASCNLRCDYCFYFDEVANREVGIRPLMNSDVVYGIISKSIELAKHITYAFQGGEPTLAGLAFFEQFVATVAQHKKDDTTISYAFQTNGLLINEVWAQFFKKHHFLVGVSFDGPPRLNDLHRYDRDGKKSGREVMQAIRLLQQYQVDFNILSVVTNELAQNIGMVFPYFVNHGLLYHQYIACMDSLQGGKSYLSPTVYATFLKELFDLWFSAWQSKKPVSVRFFDNLVGMIAGYPPESCDMSGICSANYVIESNGDVYPCDFYCIDETLLGNIVTDSFSALDEKRKEMQFIEESPNHLDACTSCPWAALCRGGCKRYRNEDGYRFCSSMQEFFPYAIKRLEIVARTLNPRQ